MTTTEQIKGIVERLGALRRYLWRWCKLIEISNEEEKTLLDFFWNNAKEAELLKSRNKKMDWRL
jgi:peptide chain release factor 2